MTYVLAPMAYIEFAQRHADHAKFQAGPPIRSLGELKQVNRRVNDSIKPKAEAGDTWDVNVELGDCEDYALTKQKELLERYGSEYLLIYLCWTETGVYHAVLVAETESGKYVLDNRHKKIQPFDNLQYKWDKRQSKLNPKIWEKVV